MEKSKPAEQRNIYALCLIVTLVSFLGFAVENIWLAVTKGYMNNRNMVLPFLLGHGLAVAAIYLMFGTPVAPRLFSLQIDLKHRYRNAFVYFLIAFVCVSIGECALGMFVEKTCGIIWWDYSGIPLHITKYTSVPTSIGFALLITLFMRYGFTPLYRTFAAMNKKLLCLLACIFMLALVLDFLHSAVIMATTRDFLLIWQIDWHS